MVVQHRDVEIRVAQPAQNIGVAEPGGMFDEKRVGTTVFGGNCVLDPLIVERSRPLEMLAGDHDNLHAERLAAQMFLKRLHEFPEIPSTRQNLGADEKITIRCFRFLAYTRKEILDILADYFRPRIVAEVVEDEIVVGTIGPHADLGIDDRAVVVVAQNVLHGARARLRGPDVQIKRSVSLPSLALQAPRPAPGAVNSLDALMPRSRAPAPRLPH